MNKIKTKNFESSLIKLESHNPILKSRSFSFSPFNLAGKIVIKIHNNYINNNPNINNSNNNNQRNFIKTISKIEESETSSREMNYFELFPSPETPHLNDFNESTNENNYNSNFHKNFTYGLLNYNKNYFNNNDNENYNNLSLLNNTINFKNNSKNLNDLINDTYINDNNNYLKTNKSHKNFSKFKKKEIIFNSSTNNIKVIERKISIPNRLRRRVKFNLETKILDKESSISLTKLELRKNQNKGRSLININKNKISLNDSKLVKNSFITFKNKNSNISSNLSIKNFPMFSKNVLIKNFDYYFNKNKPPIYPKSTENKIISSFCGYTYKNGMDETKTKISLNINLKANKNIYSFFTLYSNEIDNNEIDQIYHSISKLKSKNNVFINQVNKLYKNLKSDCLTILFKNKKIYSFYNCIQNNEKDINYKAILSNDNGFSIHIIKLNNRNLKIINNFDFIILINKTIFDVLSNQQIIKLIYMNLKYSIINNESYETFLSKIIETIFKEVIHKGVMLDMSLIFITFDNIKKIFEKKIITQINETLKNLENLDLDFDFNYNDIENSPQREIKVRNNFNLTFKENKSIQSENTLKKKYSKIYLKNSEIDNEENDDNNGDHKTKKKKKNKSFLCGLFC